MKTLLNLFNNDKGPVEAVRSVLTGRDEIPSRDRVAAGLTEIVIPRLRA